MSNEERAEEILQTKGSMTFCAKGCGYTEKVKELIAIGIAEGRKAEADNIFDEWCSGSHDEPQECGFLKQLKKENAELKKQLEGNFDEFTFSKAVEVMNEYDNLKKENEELKKDKEWLDNTNNEQTKVILQLNEQIEKMKNCKNCKNWNWKHNKCEKELKGDCFKNSKWELPE